MWKKGSRQARCARGHEMTEENSYYWKDARHCRRCRRDKEDRYRKRCPERTRATGRKSHAKYRVENAAKKKIYRDALKDEAFRHYGGPICACCGEFQKVFLTLDHKDGGGNTERRKIAKRKDFGGWHLCLYLKRHGWPSGYQVLCWNCNYGKHANSGTCPHVLSREPVALPEKVIDVIEPVPDGLDNSRLVGIRDFGRDFVD